PSVELDRGRVVGGRAGSDHDPFRGHVPLRSVSVGDRDTVLVEEPRRALEQDDVVAEQLITDHASLLLDDLTRAEGEVLDVNLVLGRVAWAVDPPVVQPGRVGARLSDRLRRNRARVHAAPADNMALLGEDDAPA